MSINNLENSPLILERKIAPQTKNFVTETFFLWLHDKNVEFGRNVRGEVNHTYNSLLGKKGLAGPLIPGGENFEELGMDRATSIVRLDLYFRACKKVMSSCLTNDPFAGLNLSTATFFDLLHHENVKCSKNVRGFVNERYNFLVASNCKYQKIPGNNLEQLGMDDQTPVKAYYYLQACREVIACFEKCLRYSHCGPLAVRDSSSSNSRSLEEEFSECCFADVIIPPKNVFEGNNAFMGYIEPNELFPEKLKPHYELGPDGIFVITGTERLFFGLLSGDVRKCQGVVGRDIEPVVKAYNDFNTLLLRVSPTREAYVELSSQCMGDKSFENRIAVIKGMLENNNMPDKAKSYYLKHLRAFGSVYLREPKEWRERVEYFGRYHYHLNDDQFSKLQAYAKAGNIIFTIGPINDLLFLKPRNVAIVDASNIKDYSTLDLQGGGNFHPRVITTMNIASHIHVPLTPEERAEFNALESLLGKAQGKYFHLSGFYKLSSYPFNIGNVGDIRSKKTLSLMRKYVLKNVLQVPGFPPIDMDRNIGVLNSLSTQQIVELCDHEETKRFTKQLVESWVTLKPSVYLAFSKVAGWKEEFEAHFSADGSNLPGLLCYLQEGGSDVSERKLWLEKTGVWRKETWCLKQLVQDFGKERLGTVVGRDISSGLKNWVSYFGKKTFEDLCKDLGL